MSRLTLGKGSRSARYILEYLSAVQYTSATKSVTEEAAATVTTEAAAIRIQHLTHHVPSRKPSCESAADTHSTVAVVWSAVPSALVMDVHHLLLHGETRHERHQDGELKSAARSKIIPAAASSSVAAAASFPSRVFAPGKSCRRQPLVESAPSWAAHLALVPALVVQARPPVGKLSASPGQRAAASAWPTARPLARPSALQPDASEARPAQRACSVSCPRDAFHESHARTQGCGAPALGL